MFGSESSPSIPWLEGETVGRNNAIKMEGGVINDEAY